MKQWQPISHPSSREGAVTVAPIDWYTEMRKCVADAAELADRISTSDSNVGGAIGRLCNAVTHLLDENKALAERVAALEANGRSRRETSLMGLL